MKLRIERTWCGEPARPDEVVELVVEAREGGLDLVVDAPFHGDPAPEAAPGFLDGLWAFEVVELFVLGPEARYTELELGPHGHHLGLTLEGERRRSGAFSLESVEIRKEGPRWTARAHLPAAQLPPRPWRLNAHAIHGQGEGRRYLSFSPQVPDFHRLERSVSFG